MGSLVFLDLTEFCSVSEPMMPPGNNAAAVPVTPICFRNDLRPDLFFILQICIVI
jgi:hypothetical protein